MMPPAIPSSVIATSPVRHRRATSSRRPTESRSATAWVSARPSPRSKREKYPINDHASVRRPKRSSPSPCSSRGMAISDTASGASSAPRFKAVLRPMAILGVAPSGPDCSPGADCFGSGLSRGSFSPLEEQRVEAGEAVPECVRLELAHAPRAPLRTHGTRPGWVVCHHVHGGCQCAP